MSTVESIKKQAEIIKDPGARLKLAEQFEAMAKTLRDATPAKQQTFREILASKNKDVAGRISRAERFGQAMAADRAKQATIALRAAGWRMKSDAKADPQVWVTKVKPGLQLRVSGDSFEIVHGDEVVQPKTSMSLMKNYLSPTQGGSVTNK